MYKLITGLLLRWGVSVLGLWVAAAILGEDRLDLGGSLSTLLIAGLVLALVNMLLKPILVFLSLPALLLTLGLFMLVVNAVLIILTDWLYGPFDVSGFWSAVLAGIIVGLVNFLVSLVLKEAVKAK